MVRREMAARYAGTAAGVLWAYAQPLLTAAAYYLVFDVVFSMRLGEQAPTRAVGTYLIAGMLPWMAFCEALSRGKPFSEAFMFGLGIASYGAWVGGTAAGVLAGGGALSGFPAIEAGLSFMLTALFLALLLSIMSRRQLPVIAVAAVATVALTLTTTPTLGILGGMLAGAAAGVARRSA